MNWETRSDGELKLNVLQGFELAIAEGQAVAARVEYAEVQEQLRGERPPSALQLVMTIDAAEAIGLQLLEQARVARGEQAH